MWASARWLSISTPSLVLTRAADRRRDLFRRAYRRLALAHHPDWAGPASAETFARIAEAYRNVPGPTARTAYDAHLFQRRARVRPRRGGGAIGRARLERRVLRTAPPHPRRAPQPRAPCAGADRPSKHRAASTGMARLELHLERAEAARGGTALVEMPLSNKKTPAVGGQSGRGLAPSLRARGAGLSEERAGGRRHPAGGARRAGGDRHAPPAGRRAPAGAAACLFVTPHRRLAGPRRLMVQLNTPYPATAYLAGFLRLHADSSACRSSRPIRRSKCPCVFTAARGWRGCGPTSRLPGARRRPRRRKRRSGWRGAILRR